LDIDLVAPFDLARECLPAFRAQGGGAIVNITSMSGLVATGMFVPSAGYSAAKAGLAHLTRELAAQWGRYNVRVNAVSPGFFPSEMTAASGTEPGALPESFVPRTALARPGGAGDIEGVVQFLLSDAARYVTGQQIAVDGGYTVT
jgi:NAD(P)-dependent dehydrogenase (short-subunit alcohol dehydrogenase family)